MSGDHEPPSSDFVPITDSAFARLDEAGRTAILKAQHDELVRRHNELKAGQHSINHRLDAHNKQIRAQVVATKEVRDRVSVLDANVIENTKLTIATKADTSQLVKFFNDGKTTLSTIEWVAKFIGKVGIPAGLIYGGYKAFMAWLPQLLALLHLNGGKP